MTLTCSLQAASGPGEPAPGRSISRRAVLPHAASAERVDPPPSRAPSPGWTASYQRGKEKEEEGKLDGLDGWKWRGREERGKGEGGGEKGREVEKRRRIDGKGGKEGGKQKGGEEKVEGWNLERKNRGGVKRVQWVGVSVDGCPISTRSRDKPQSRDCM